MTRNKRGGGYWDRFKDRIGKTGGKHEKAAIAKKASKAKDRAERKTRYGERTSHNNWDAVRGGWSTFIDDDVIHPLNRGIRRLGRALPKRISGGGIKGRKKKGSRTKKTKRARTKRR